MATVGNTGTPSQTYGQYGLNASNVMAIQVTMPQAGQITSLSAYFAGKSGGGNITARLCIWDTSGNLLAQTGDMTVGAGSGGIGGQSFHTANLSSPYNASSGQNLRIGWWRHASQSDEWTENNGGTEYQATDSSNSAPGNETFSSVSGTPSIYATYTPSEAWVNTGTPGSPNWVAGQVVVNTGTPGSPTWTSASEVDVNTGTSGSPVWTPGA
jgi:hypothetical protein